MTAFDPYDVFDFAAHLPGCPMEGTERPHGDLELLGQLDNLGRAGYRVHNKPHGRAQWVLPSGHSILHNGRPHWHAAVHAGYLPHEDAVGAYPDHVEHALVRKGWTRVGWNQYLTVHGLGGPQKGHVEELMRNKLRGAPGTKYGAGGGMHLHDTQTNTLHYVPLHAFAQSGHDVVKTLAHPDVTHTAVPAAVHHPLV